MSAPKWAKGMRKLGPGCYVDASGALHISQAELCEHFGVPETEENCRTLERCVQNALRARAPEATLRVVEVEEGA